MAFKRHLRQLALTTMLLSPAWGQTVVGSDYNSPSAGPPGSYFAAATTMPVAALVSAVAKASKAPQSAAFPINNSKDSPTATIHADFASLSTVCYSRSRIELNNRQRIKRIHRQPPMCLSLTWMLTVTESTTCAK